MSDDSTIEENLASYRKAIQEEYEVAKSGTSDQIADAARNRLVAILPEAGDTLVEIMRVGTKEDATRLQACKFVYEMTLAKPNAGNAKSDDVERIIQTLMGANS